MAARSVKQAPELELLVALQAARASANTLFQTEKGSVQRSDGRVTEFDTVPLEDVQAEERRLTAAHGLLLWTDRVSTVRISDYQFEIHATFTLVHITSGATKSFEFVGPCFPLSEHNNNGAWASAATKTYAWRCAVLDIFDIPVRKKGHVDATTPPQATLPASSLAAHHQPFTAALASQRQPYTPERMLEQLQVWADNQKAIAVAGGAKGEQFDSPLPEAWAACRRSAQNAGITIRPLMPGDKPRGEQEYAELYDFLYTENLQDGLLP